MLLHRKGWLQRRTGLEKVLLCVLGVCGAAMMVTGALVTTGGLETKAGGGREAQEDVCLTAECAVAGRSRGWSGWSGI